MLLDAVAWVTVTGSSREGEPSLAYLRRAVLDAARTGTVRHCANQVIKAAQHVRDLLDAGVRGDEVLVLTTPDAEDDVIVALLG